MFHIDHNFYALISLIFSFVLCYKVIPSIIKVAKLKNLYDEPNHRSSHTHVVPSLGGVAIFLSFSLSSLILSNGFMAKELKFIIASTIIMFALGIMDDIVNISPKKKLYGQIFAALIVIIMGDIRFSSFHGLFGIYELNYYVSILFTIFVMIVITNGFNLIDGIDGLASGISALCTLSFGIWFYITGHYDYAVLAASLFGALIAFFRFNVFSKKNKIFMGDTGSLILGLLLSILVIKFNEINILQDFKYAIPCAPIVSIAILAVPLFDTARVMIIRLKNGKSPFQPDKNHVHHRMLSLGYKHVQASLRIIIVNIIFIATGFCLSFIGQYSLLCVTILMGVFFSWLPSFLLSRKKPKQNIKIEPKQIFLEQKKETENIAEGINA